MECKSETNKSFCNCSYPCSRKGICCDCIRYHIKNSEMPACFFPNDAERTYNRSVSYFVSLYQKDKLH